MSRYIDADALRKCFLVPHELKCGIQAGMDEYALKCIDETPTVDAVRVVRCKECVHGIYGIDETGEYRWCENAWNYVDDDAYCADGERRTE